MRRPRRTRGCISSPRDGATWAWTAIRARGGRTRCLRGPTRFWSCSPEGGPMPAYWLARARVNDPVEYKKYTDRVPAILAKFGAKVLRRGGRYQTVEGVEKFNRFVVIEFPTLEQGVACFNSKEYQEAAAFRRRNKAGENELVMVEAGEGQPTQAG